MGVRLTIRDFVLVPDYIYHIDFSNLSSLTVDGSNIVQANNLAGSGGNNLVQPTSTEQPELFLDTISGRHMARARWVGYGATKKELNSENGNIFNTDIINDCTIFLIHRSNVAYSYQQISFNGNEGSDQTRFFMVLPYNNSSKSYICDLGNSGDNRVRINNTDPMWVNYTNTNIITAVVDSNINKCKVILNKEQPKYSRRRAPATVTGGLRVCTDGNGDWGEIIVYDRVLNDNEIGKVQDYLAHKWRITV